VPKRDFEVCWAAWVAELAHVGALATTHEERALVRRATQVVEGKDLLGQLCHDMKDPLASMLMGLALLEKTHGYGPATQTIIAAARRLDRVVTAAHDLALLRRGEYQVNLLSLPIASLITTIVEKYRQTTRRGVRIDLVIAANLPNVLGDASAFSRVVQELLDNAVGFSDDGGVVDVTITAEGDQVVVMIADRGPGIDAEHLPHVFDEARNRAHRPRRGVGRGLPVAHALAVLQEASVTIGRVTPKGTAATLRVRSARGTLPQT
jgi:signal transduction histidine kinase